mmetsp:Transcript_26627/g.52272  ORF Transcript_26627/g.52272 Transcript_26627/m.52272 type:complete len:205 (-) Transcript_26627:1334-1948(-)
MVLFSPRMWTFIRSNSILDQVICRSSHVLPLTHRVWREREKVLGKLHSLQKNAGKLVDHTCRKTAGRSGNSMDLGRPQGQHDRGIEGRDRPSHLDGGGMLETGMRQPRLLPHAKEKKNSSLCKSLPTSCVRRGTKFFFSRNHFIQSFHYVCIHSVNLNFSFQRVDMQRLSLSFPLLHEIKRLHVFQSTWTETRGNLKRILKTFG